MDQLGALRIGTRGSQLALWQAQSVARRLETSGVRSELVIITTAGDRLQRAPISGSGGKALFVKEIEDALSRGDIDLAVHSAKDMSATLPDGLEIGATLPRDDPRDAFIMPTGAPTGTLDEVLSRLGSEPRVATGSVRRMAQLAALIPRATFMPIRGNVDTRLRKLDAGGYDALVLASAGIRRLGLGARITSPIPVEHCVPAPGQGIIAVETRSDDARTRLAVGSIHDDAAGISLAAERALVIALGGGCQLPLGGLAILDDKQLEMHAVVAARDGSRVVKGSARGPASDPDALGRRVADQLVQDGAMDILDAIRQAQGHVKDS